MSLMRWQLTGKECMGTDNIMASRLPDASLVRGNIITIAVIALAYFLAHQISFFFPDSGSVLMTIWPSAGIGLAAMLLNPRRLWPWICAALFISGNMANILSDRPLAVSLGFMSANIAESLACAWFITHLNGAGVRFHRVREVMALAAASMFINGITALLGAGTAALALGASFWTSWETWWVADGLGLFLITPLIVSWSGFRITVTPVRWFVGAEFLLSMAVLYAVVYFTFNGQPGFLPVQSQPYMVVAMLAWPAFRFGQRGMTLSLVIIAVLALTSRSVIDGPLLWGGITLTERLLQVQMFLAILSFAAFLLSSSFIELKTAGRLAREGRESLLALGDNLPNGMIYQLVRGMDGKLRYVYVSAGVERICGISPGDLLRDPSLFFRQVHPEDLPQIEAAGRAGERDMTPFSSLVRFRRENGEMRWMQVSSMPRRMEEGGTLWDGVLIDVTEQIEAREALRQSEEWAGTILQKMGEGFWIVDDSASIIDVNDSMCRILGYERSELLGMKIWDIEAAESPGDVQARMERLRVNGSDTFETRHRCRDGREIHVAVSVTYLPERNSFFAFHHDITERKTAEDDLRKALRERETLLRELYHRTKNNMQVISALLELQRDHSGDMRLHEAFTDTQNRIRSMALVHQKLYEARDLSHVNLKDYISDLAGLLMSGYNISKSRISLVSEMEDVYVLIDSAIPCGLILNELISNSLKYAFPDGRVGTITLDLSRKPDGTIRISVADDGIGFSDTFDHRVDGRLGLQNIFALAENQLRGRVTFGGGKGVDCILEFMDNLYSPRV